MNLHLIYFVEKERVRFQFVISQKILYIIQLFYFTGAAIVS